MEFSTNLADLVEIGFLETLQSNPYEDHEENKESFPVQEELEPTL